MSKNTLTADQFYAAILSDFDEKLRQATHSSERIPTICLIGILDFRKFKMAVNHQFYHSFKLDPESLRELKYRDVTFYPTRSIDHGMFFAGPMPPE